MERDAATGSSSSTGSTRTPPSCHRAQTVIIRTEERCGRLTLLPSSIPAEGT